MGGDGDDACREEPGSVSDASQCSVPSCEKTYDTHALPGSNECCDTKHEADCRKCSPASTSITESDENRRDDTTKDAENTKTTSEDDTGPIAVANGPSNEVRVGLMT